jgi:hypothetical protein
MDGLFDHSAGKIHHRVKQVPSALVPACGTVVLNILFTEPF